MSRSAIWNVITCMFAQRQLNLVPEAETIFEEESP
jgi:hypothetical protein